MSKNPPFKIRCRIGFHNWNKWQFITDEIGKNYTNKFYILIQKRQCRDCEYVQSNRSQLTIN